MLVLVGEGALVEVRPRGAQRTRTAHGGGAGRVVGVGRVVRRVGTGAVQPVERVDRHDVAVGQVVERRVEEPGDVGLAVGRRGLVVVRVTDVVDQRHRLVPGAVHAVRAVGAVPVRCDRERLGLLREHVGVELVDEAVDLVLGHRDRRAAAHRVAAVAGRELQRLVAGSVARHPDLDLVADALEDVVLQVDLAGEVVQRRPRARPCPPRRRPPRPGPSGTGAGAVMDLASGSALPPL